MMRTTRLASFFVLFVLFALSAGQSPELLPMDESVRSSVEPNSFRHFTASTDPAATDLSYYIFQVHTAKYSITFSGQKVPQYYDNATNTTNGGLVALISPEHRIPSYDLYVYSRRNQSQSFFISAKSYKAKVPIPGGCCKTCNIDIDPNLYVLSNPWYTTLTFELANGGFAPLDDESVHLCSGRDPPYAEVHYDIYLHSLGGALGSISDEKLLEGWSMMNNVTNIKKYGTKVGNTLGAKDLKQVTLSSSPGRGIVLNVLAYDQDGNEVAYVPLTTYGCSFTSEENSCDDALGAHVATKVICTVIGIIGIVMAFFGHRLFKLELVLVGLLYCMFFTYIALTQATLLSHYDRLGISFGVGIVGGLVFFAVWWRFNVLMGFVLLIGMVFGFLVSSIVFYTPFGALSVWQTEINFWIAFSCGVLIPVVLLLLKPRLLNIVTTSVTGSYAFVVAITEYVNGSLVFILFDILKKASMPQYTTAFSVYPLDLQDIVLAVVWGFFSVAGFVFQYYQAKKADRKGKSEFPPSPYRQKRDERIARRFSRRNIRNKYGESQPLLDT